MKKNLLKIFNSKQAKPTKFSYPLHEDPLRSSGNVRKVRGGIASGPGLPCRVSRGASERWRRWIETGGASEFVSDGSINARAQSPQGECQDVTRDR